MKVKYSPELEAGVDRMIQLAKPLFLEYGPQEKSDHEAHALLVLAGAGGARLINNESGAPLWVATPKLSDILSAARRQARRQADARKGNNGSTKESFHSFVSHVLRTSSKSQAPFEDSPGAIDTDLPLSQRHPAFADALFLFFQYSHYGKSWQVDFLDDLVFHLYNHESLTITEMSSKLENTLGINQARLERKGGRTFREALADFHAARRKFEMYKQYERSKKRRKSLKVIDGGLNPR
jgi:hypothetical protein